MAQKEALAAQLAESDNVRVCMRHMGAPLKMNEIRMKFACAATCSARVYKGFYGAQLAAALGA
eukprot:1157932-Pelagomonas_calceolata.AAC.1